MNIIEKNHKSKSEQLKRMKRKLKFKTQTTINLHQLQTRLAHLKNNPVKGTDYYTPGVSFGSDGSDFLQDVAMWEAQVALLENLIEEIKRN